MYLVGVLLIGVIASKRDGNATTIEGYFLANKKMWWLPVGASLFVSNMGAEHCEYIASSSIVINHQVVTHQV